MARVLLNSETFTVFNSTADVFGSLGYDRLQIGGASSSVTVSQTVERIDLPGTLADYTFQTMGNQVRVARSGFVVASISVAEMNGNQVSFADGSAFLKISALNSASLGNTQIGTVPVVISANALGSSFNTLIKSDPALISVSPVAASTSPNAIGISASNAASGFGAAGGDFSFNVGEGNYNTAISGFGLGDSLSFFGSKVASLTVLNNNFSDGVVVLTGSSVDGSVVGVTLTGISVALDGQVLGVSSFNSAFGAGSLVA